MQQNETKGADRDFFVIHKLSPVRILKEEQTVAELLKNSWFLRWKFLEKSIGFKYIMVEFHMASDYAPEIYI